MRSKSVFGIRKFWVVWYSRVPCLLSGWSGIFAVRCGEPLIVIFVGFSTKKYLWTSLRILLLMTYRDSTGTVMLVCRMPRFRMNCLMAFGWMPRSLRDCSDHVRGSFQPWYIFDLTSWALFDFEILIPSIAKWPL